ncbi:MAG: hypothetical protein QOH01_2144 [Verrucomicrobiota bacterium]|jgi:hypothetical protein
MATRVSIIFAFVALTSLCAAARADVALRSQRRNVLVRVTPPSGWAGPGHDVRPSYDSFGWSHGQDPTASYLSIRFDPYTDEPGDRHSADDIVIHYNSTPPAKIREQLKREFAHPELERIATLRVAGQSVRVYGIYIPGGDHSYVAEVVRAGTVIFIELLSPTRRKLERHRDMFLSFVRSLHVDT